MASIAHVVTMTDGTQMTVTAQVADADVGRLLAAYGAKYGLEDTNAIVSKFISDVVVDSLAFVRTYEQGVAAAAAAAAIQPIPVTFS